MVSKIYISDFQIYNRNTKYLKNDLLCAPRVDKTKTKRLIGVCGVEIWNKLPIEMQTLTTKTKHIFSKITIGLLIAAPTPSNY